MLVFLLDCLCFCKLLKLHQTEDKISSNLLKRKQSSRKTSIMCRRIKTNKSHLNYLRSYKILLKNLQSFTIRTDEYRP